MVRYDSLLAPEWMYSKFDKTPEGFLKGKAVICTTGVYEYRKADGSVVKELRLPEEVFATDFLESLKLKPLTLTHPTELITSDNVKQYQIGTLGEVVDTDNYHLAIDMIIHDATAISAVQKGVQALSVGYTCELESAEPGAVWCGQTYDYVQRKIRANHTSLVQQGRAGDAARIRLDSSDAVMVHPAPMEEKEDTIGGSDMPDKYKAIKIDGIDFEAEVEVIKAYNASTAKADALEASIADMQSKLDSTNTEKTVLEAERDTLKDKADALEAEVKELKERKLDQAVIDAAVAKKVRVMDAARLAEVEVADGTADLDIQKAVILKVFPKANLDGKDASYIDARFDGAVEMLSVKAEEKADAEVRKVASPEQSVKADSTEVIDARSARERMIADLKTRYQSVKK